MSESITVVSVSVASSLAMRGRVPVALFVLALILKAEALSHAAQFAEAEEAARAKPSNSGFPLEALVETEEETGVVIGMGALVISLITYGLFTIAGWVLARKQMKRIQKGHNPLHQAEGLAESAKQEGLEDADNIVKHMQSYQERPSWAQAALLCQNSHLKTLITGISATHTTLSKVNQASSFYMMGVDPVIVESSHYIHVERLQTPVLGGEPRHIVGMRHAGTTTDLKKGSSSKWRSDLTREDCKFMAPNPGRGNRHDESVSVRYSNLKKMACATIGNAKSKEGLLRKAFAGLRELIKEAEDDARRVPRASDNNPPELRDLTLGIQNLVKQTFKAGETMCQKRTPTCDDILTFNNEMSKININFQKYMGWVDKCDAFTSEAPKGSLNDLVAGLMSNANPTYMEDALRTAGENVPKELVDFVKGIILEDKCEEARKSGADLPDGCSAPEREESFSERFDLSKLTKKKLSLRDARNYGMASRMKDKENAAAPKSESGETPALLEVDESSSQKLSLKRKNIPLLQRMAMFKKDMRGRHPFDHDVDFLEVSSKYWDMGVPIESMGSIGGMSLFTIQPTINPILNVMAPINVIIHWTYAKKTTKELVCLEKVAEESREHFNPRYFATHILSEVANLGMSLKESMFDRNQLYMIEGTRQEFKASTSIYNSARKYKDMPTGYTLNFESSASPVSGVMTNACSVPMPGFKDLHLDAHKGCGVPKALYEWNDSDKKKDMIDYSNMRKMDHLSAWMDSNLNSNPEYQCSMVQRLDTTCKVMSSWMETTINRCGTYFQYAVRQMTRAVCTMSKVVHHFGCIDSNCSDIRDVINVPCRAIDEYNQAVFHMQYWMKHVASNMRSKWNPEWTAKKMSWKTKVWKKLASLVKRKE